jgi:hypothetical protein
VVSDTLSVSGVTVDTDGKATFPAKVTVNTDAVDPTDAVNRRSMLAYKPTYAYLATKRSTPYFWDGGSGEADWTMYFYYANSGEQLSGFETPSDVFSTLTTTLGWGMDSSQNFYASGEWTSPGYSFDLLGARLVNDSTFSIRIRANWIAYDNNYNVWTPANIDAIQIDNTFRTFLQAAQGGGSDGSISGCQVKAAAANITAPDNTTVKEIALTFRMYTANGSGSRMGGRGFIPNFFPLGYQCGPALTLGGSAQHVRRYYV